MSVNEWLCFLRLLLGSSMFFFVLFVFILFFFFTMVRLRVKVAAIRKTPTHFTVTPVCPFMSMDPGSITGGGWRWGRGPRSLSS